MAADPEVTPQLWGAVDDYLNSKLVPFDYALDAAIADSAAAGLPAIHVAPNQGKLLHILARAIGARRILEVGTLGGYSTIWLARALPADGKLITLESEPRHAEVAQVNIARAGLHNMVEIRVGAALDSLQALANEGIAPFDLVFIDADKVNNAAYVTWALKLSRPGALVIVDNVIRHGRILDGESTDVDIQGTRRMFDLFAAEPRLCATAFQTVGEKGLDGLAFAVVLP
jgi:predicted O-methyltransferase YrrM